MLMSLPSVRGRRAVIYSRDSRAVRILVRQLGLLGISTQVNPEAKNPETDFCFLDIDTVLDDGMALPGGLSKMQVIALVGTETPGRLEWMMQHDPAAILMKPLNAHGGVYTSVVMALVTARRREQEFLKVLKLEERIRARRIVVAAIVKLMKQYGIEEPEAFGMLRNAAQQRRMTIETLCTEVAGDAFLPVRLIK